MKSARARRSAKYRVWSPVPVCRWPCPWERRPGTVEAAQTNHATCGSFGPLRGRRSAAPSGRRNDLARLGSPGWEVARAANRPPQPLPHGSERTSILPPCNLFLPFPGGPSRTGNDGMSVQPQSSASLPVGRGRAGAFRGFRPWPTKNPTEHDDYCPPGARPRNERASSRSPGNRPRSEHQGEDHVGAHREAVEGGRERAKGNAPAGGVGPPASGGGYRAACAISVCAA